MVPIPAGKLGCDFGLDRRADCGSARGQATDLAQEHGACRGHRPRRGSSGSVWSIQCFRQSPGIWRWWSLCVCGKLARRRRLLTAHPESDSPGFDLHETTQ